MKKIIAIILSLSILCTLTACNNKSSAEIQNSSKTEEINTEEQTSAENKEDAELLINEELLTILKEIPAKVQAGTAGSSLKVVICTEEINEFFSNNLLSEPNIEKTIEYFFNNEKPEDFEPEGYQMLVGFINELYGEIEIDVVDDFTVETIENAGLTLTDFDWKPETTQLMTFFTEEVSKYVD